MSQGTWSRSARWLVALVPIAVVAVLEILSDSLLDEALPYPLDTILVIVAVVALGLVLAAVAFRRIDALTGALVSRNAELEARGASARALHRVSLAIASMSDVDLVLAAVVTHARELLAADVAILLLEDASGRLVPRAQDPARPCQVDAVRPAGGAVAIGGDVAMVASDPAAAMLPFVDAASAAVRLAAPLQRGGETIGLLAVGSARSRGFGADELETLASLANQATIALEHARLEARLRELAVVEERERIARELHDGIAQVLGYVNTKTQAVEEYLAAGRIDEARVQVADLGAAARAVYVDVRESILGLRGPIEPGQGLGGAILAYAARSAAASSFVLEADIPGPVLDLRLDPAAEAHLYRIVQEALTNVRKHASAGRVWISMRIGGGALQIRVEDDGRGMPAAQAGSPAHYGIRSMRERATAIGASLELGPAHDDRGTALVVVLPLADHVASHSGSQAVNEPTPAGA